MLYGLKFPQDQMRLFAVSNKGWRAIKNIETVTVVSDLEVRTEKVNGWSWSFKEASKS